MNWRLSRSIGIAVMLTFSWNSQAATPIPGPSPVILTANQTHRVVDQLLAGEICQKNLTAAQASANQCWKEKGAVEGFWQTPAWAIATPLLGVVLGFLVASVAHH